jgi:hypothetical protein
VLWEVKQFLLHQWRPLCLLVLCIYFIALRQHILCCPTYLKTSHEQRMRLQQLWTTELWCLIPLTTIFQLYRGGQCFIGEKTGVSGNNHWPPASHRQTLSHNVVSSTPHQELWTKTTNVIEYIKERVLTTTIVIWFCNSITRIKYKINKFCIRNVMLRIQLGLGLWYLTHFQQYFSYIVAVSFIGGGNRSTRRKPSTCHKSLTNFIS